MIRERGRGILLAVAAASVAGAQAPATVAPRGEVRTVAFWAQSLGVRKEARVWLPPSYYAEPTRRYPVAFYLHGLGGNETNWILQGRLDAALDSATAIGLAEMIVVMPDGDDGWYTTWNTLGDFAGCRRSFTPRGGDTADSYCVPWLHYDDYLARDLVAYVDSAFRTRTGRRYRALAGLSMGGYGAIALALAYPDVFAAAASHSGVLAPLLVGRDSSGGPRYAADMQQLRAAWGERWFPRVAGAFGTDTAAWWSRDPARLARRARNRGGPLPALMIDVGTEDNLLEQNRAFRDGLRALGVPHRYAEWPGGHDWSYWRKHVVESLAWIAGQFPAG